MGKEGSHEVLELAEDIGRWLVGNAIQNDNGTVWPDNALSPDTIGYDLASGVAGKVVYFVALYRATGNVEYLKMAEGGADYLIGVLQDPSSFEQNPRRASLYTGISGIGVALLHVQRHASDQKYGRAVKQIVNQLGEWSVEDGGGLRWSDEFNDLIYGDAGTALFLELRCSSPTLHSRQQMRKRSIWRCRVHGSCSARHKSRPQDRFGISGAASHLISPISPTGPRALLMCWQR